MQVAERESNNAYGPYGIALGRSGADVRCAYMWQWIDQNRLPAEAGVTGPLSIRIRLCKTDTTFDAMAAEMDHLTIGGPASIEQVAANQPIHVIEAPAQAHKSARVQRNPSRRIAMVHKHRAVIARRDETPTPDTATDGPRYMSPTTMGIRPAPIMPVAPAAPTVLSGDLPAQAYQGPTARPSAAITATAKYY